MTFRVGSLKWRYINYGVLATLKYLSSRLVGRFSKTTLSPESIVESLPWEMNVRSTDFESAYKEIIKELERNYRNKRDSFPIKKVLEEENYLRFKQIGLLLAEIGADCYIETGTQHGVSAFIIGELGRRFYPATKIYTIDVTSNELISISTNVNYFIAKAPVRSEIVSFAKLTKRAKTVWFHDSDHTYENMAFEFSFAWDDLKVDYLVSDDIQLNSAFYDFCKKRGLVANIFKLNQGPCLGYVVR